MIAVTENKKTKIAAPISLTETHPRSKLASSDINRMQKVYQMKTKNPASHNHSTENVNIKSKNTRVHNS